MVIHNVSFHCLFTVSRSSNSSDTLGAKDVEEPRKVSDIIDKVYEGARDNF
jgi:hypothetical protein